MYEKILVALDGSQFSEVILPYSRLLADKLKLAVELIHVIDRDLATPTSAAGQARYQEIMATENEKSLDYLKKIAASFPAGTKIQCSVEPGNPAEVIVDKAAEHRHTLIAMCTHGRSGVNRWLIGSVADKVLHGAANPLLLVRAGDTAAVQGTALWRRILVPLDGSALAETVIPHAAELARPLVLEIVLMRVFGVPTPVFAEDYGPYVEELWTQLEDEAQKYLAEKKQNLLAQGLANVATIATAGFPAEKIIDAARQRKDALVAMCTHGRSGVNRWVMGSVTDRVVRHGGEPVLIIRATA
ncbi:MAG TPA: universal stress protein [Candidatus Limnocylindrales bacterium]|nr:universal stress protein [Candidatus Limnocylindrales bacterium]